MTQFASSLYPQTNPTNQALIRYREHIDAANSYSVKPVTPAEWIWVMDTMFLDGVAAWSSAQVNHARRVLTRLANLSG